MPLDSSNPFADLVPKAEPSHSDNPFADLIPKTPKEAPDEPSVIGGILSAPIAGVVAGSKELGQTAQTVGGGRPEVAEDNSPAAQPVHWSDLLHPGTLAEKSLYQLGKSYPTLAMGVAGGVAGSIAGGGPEEPLGIVGGVAGGAMGAALASGIQALGPRYAAALKETNDPDKAFDLALQRAATEGAISGAGWAAFNWAPFQGTVKNVLLQAFGVQPGVAAAGQAAQNVEAGKPVGEGVGEAIPGAIVGTLVPMAGHAAAERIAGRAAARAETPPTAEPVEPEVASVAAPGEAPAIGDIVGVKDIPGRLVVTSYSNDGLVRLTDEDGLAHLMTVGDFQKYVTEPPPEEAAEPAAPEAALQPEPEAVASVVPPVSSAAMPPESAPPTEPQAAAEVPNEPLEDLFAQPDQPMGRFRTTVNINGQEQSIEGPTRPPPPTPEDQAAAQARSNLLVAAGITQPLPPAEAQLAQRIPADQAQAAPPTPIKPVPPQDVQVGENPPPPPPIFQPSIPAPQEQSWLRAIPDRATEAIIPSTGKAFSTQYGIADVHDLITSHHDDLAPNSEYPQALQPRARERAETEAQLTSILNGGAEGKFRPELLGETPDAATGAPVVGSDRLVEGGNARTMALRRAYERGLPQAEEYRSYLAAQGYPIEGVESPMLVRMNSAGMDMPQREQLSRDLNVPAVATMSATEQAMADARQIAPGSFQGYRGGDLFSAENLPFVKSLMGSFVRPTDLPAMTNPEGGLSQGGRRRVQAAVLAKAYGDSGIISALTEDPESSIKAIGGALTDAAPAWSQLKDGIQAGRIAPEYDLTSPLLEATRLISHARDEGRNVAEFVAQRGLFGGDVSPEVESMLRWMLGGDQYSRRYGRQKIADTLTEYADSVTRPLRIGETRAPATSLVENAREVAHGASGDLFLSPLGQQDGAEAVRPGAGEGRPEAQRPQDDQARLESPTNRPGASAERPTFRDLKDQFAASLAQRPTDPHGAASSWVTMMGDATGHEHVVSLDGNGDLIGAHTDGRANAVDLKNLVTELSDPAQEMVVHHNHPSGNTLSGSDINLLRMPGLDTIVAHTPDGNISSARLAPELRMLDPSEIGDALANAHEDAKEAVFRRFDRMVEKGTITPDDAARAFNDIVNRSMSAAGLIDYMTTQRLPLIDPLVRSVVRDAAKDIRQIHVSDEDFRDLVNRSPNTLQPDEILGGLPRRDADLAAGPGGGPRGEASAEDAQRAGEAIRAAEAPVGPSLAEEGPRDLFDRATEDAVQNAADKMEGKSRESFLREIERQLATLPASRGGPVHAFNLINKNFTMPRIKAALDQMSSDKWMPELAKKRQAAQYLTKYRTGFSSWNGKPAETWNKVLSAMEILTLQGRNVPTDGRAIVAENTTHPLAARSKVGDIVRLDTPEEIQMFGDARRTMDGIWKDLVTAVTRQLGWEGPPNAAAIAAEAEKVPTLREANNLRRAAKIVGAVEYQQRNAYIPLMRSGDYYFRVTPKAGTPDKPGILGWTGDGFPPTTMFKMIDSHSWLERATGGQWSETPKLVGAELSDLRKQFPDTDYNIDHGYMFKNQNGIRDLNIPAVEKLMMLVGNDVKEQLSRNMGEGPGAEAYEGVIDNVLDQVARELAPAARGEMYKERLASFRRTRRAIPGYDEDLARSIGRYTHWLASYTASIPYREQIERANEALQSHPDQRTTQFWRDWDRRNEDFGDQFSGPLMALRQANFYWLLAMNAASTSKILLHGPLLGMPTLTTGLSAAGKMRAIGDYLAAAGQLIKALRVGKSGIELRDAASGVKDPQLRSLIAEAEEQGILHPQGADEMRAVAGRGEEVLSPTQRAGRRFLEIWSSNISAADRMIRAAMLRAAYATAKREGMDTVSKAWDHDLNWRNAPEKTPEAFAKMMVDRTAGMWGDMNRIPFLRSQIGGMIGQYRTYELNYLSTLHQMMWHMGREGKTTAALMMLGLGSLGGAAALPFSQDLEKAADTVWGWWTGLEPDLAANSKNAINGLMHHLGIWEDAGNDILHGPRPFGIDLGSGIGFGDLLSRNTASPLDFAGAAVSSFANSALRAKQRAKSGQGPAAVIAELMPNAVKHMIDGLYPEAGLMSASGSVKIGDASELSTGDRVKKALGFQLAPQAVRFENFREKMNAITAQKQALTNAENRFANLQDRGQDTTGAEKDISDLVVRGVTLGIYPNARDETARVMRDLRYRAQQRASPSTQSKTMQRMQQVQP